MDVFPSVPTLPWFRFNINHRKQRGFKMNRMINGYIYGEKDGY